jgi:hypothetical protein
MPVWLVVIAAMGANNIVVGIAAGETQVTRKAFEELSERNVSRAGEQALKMTSVKWEHFETDHFIFHSETGFAAAQLASASEEFYREIKEDLGITEDAYQRKSHLYVFLNETAWREFAAHNRLDPWTGGCCNGRELFFRSRPHFSFQGTTLPHEMTHLALYRFIGGDIPLWLNEGFAEFESTHLYRMYLKKRNYRLPVLAPLVEKDRYIALDTLTRAVDYPSNAADARAFYAESQRLVSYLHQMPGGGPSFLKFMKRHCAGLTFESAAKEIYGSAFPGMNEFNEKFRAYATQE